MRWSVLMSLMVTCCTVCLATASIAAEAAREYQVKAAFLYNFAQFVQWPESALPQPTSPIVIGIVGRDPFGGALEEVIGGKAVEGRPLLVERYSDAGSIGQCHLLFVGRGGDEPNRLSQILRAVAGRTVLTVGETDDHAAAGGVIRLYTESNKVRFEVNVAAAEQAELKISSKLLRLAKIYKK